MGGPSPPPRWHQNGVIPLQQRPPQPKRRSYFPHCQAARIVRRQDGTSPGHRTLPSILLRAGQVANTPTAIVVISPRWHDSCLRDHRAAIPLLPVWLLRRATKEATTRAGTLLAFPHNHTRTHALCCEVA